MPGNSRHLTNFMPKERFFDDFEFKVSKHNRNAVKDAAGQDGSNRHVIDHPVKLYDRSENKKNKKDLVRKQKRAERKVRRKK